MKELDSRLPILKVFAKLISNEGKESQYEVFVTDKDLDTYKTLWKTPKDKDPSDEKILKDIQHAFLIERSTEYKTFEKVQHY